MEIASTIVVACLLVVPVFSQIRCKLLEDCAKATVGDGKGDGLQVTATVCCWLPVAGADLNLQVGWCAPDCPECEEVDGGCNQLSVGRPMHHGSGGGNSSRHHGSGNGTRGGSGTGSGTGTGKGNETSSPEAPSVDEDVENKDRIRLRYPESGEVIKRTKEIKQMDKPEEDEVKPHNWKSAFLNYLFRT